MWNRRLLIAGAALSVAGTVLFMITRQPYAGMIYLTLLIVKGILVNSFFSCK